MGAGFARSAAPCRRRSTWSSKRRPEGVGCPGHAVVAGTQGRRSGRRRRNADTALSSRAGPRPAGPRACWSSRLPCRLSGPPSESMDTGTAVAGQLPGGRMAMARRGAPLPPAIFIGSAMTCAPRAGRRARLVRFSNAGMSFEQHTMRLEQRRLAVVDARCVDPDRPDRPVGDQPRRGRGVQAREVQFRDCRLAALGGPEVRRGVRPALSKSRYGSAGSRRRDAAVRASARSMSPASPGNRRRFAARSVTSTMTAGPISRSSGIWSTVWRPCAKWIGESMWVPPCSEVAKSLAA